MTQIRPITRKLILEEAGKWDPPWSDICCMFSIKKRKFQCNMWLEIFDAVGGIGFVSWEDDEAVGQMIFLPKKYARKIGLPISRPNEEIEKTMVIGCLYVPKEHRNKGIASAMIRELISFCDDHGYKRIEVPVDLRPPDKKMFSTISFFPFRKFGFVIDEASLGWEFELKTRIAVFDKSNSSLNGAAT